MDFKVGYRYAGGPVFWVSIFSPNIDTFLPRKIGQFEKRFFGFSVLFSKICFSDGKGSARNAQKRPFRPQIENTIPRKFNISFFGGCVEKVSILNTSIFVSRFLGKTYRYTNHVIFKKNTPTWGRPPVLFARIVAKILGCGGSAAMERSLKPRSLQLC